MYWDAAWASSLMIRRLESVRWGTFGMEGVHGSTCWVCICEDVLPVVLAGLVCVGRGREGAFTADSGDFYHGTAKFTSQWYQAIRARIFTMLGRHRRGWTAGQFT